MIFFTSARILNDDRTIDLATCAVCEKEPHVSENTISCDCGNRISMNEFSETVAAWNRANSDMGDIIKQLRRGI